MTTTARPIKANIIQALRAKLSLLAAALLMSAMGLFGAGIANAAGTVNFTSPPDGSSAPVGTLITPTGLASITGTAGAGLDLAIVIDVSGSVSGTPLQAEKDAAKALIASLPTNTSAVTIISFSSAANTVQTLLPLTPASNITTLNAAIDGLSAGGGTNIGSGIVAATTELTSVRATPTWSQQMIVLSDGSTIGNPAVDAANALTAGVENVHSVAFGFADVTTMQNIATAGNGTFVDLTTGSGGTLQDLIDIFSGLGGGLVGVDKIIVTLPDGTIIDPNSISGVGAFTVDQAYAIGLGPNTWKVEAFFDDGTTAEAFVTVNGVGGGVGGVVPLPAGLPLLLGGLGVFGALRLRRRKG